MKYAIIFCVGAVAQLGEHCVRIAGVRGSNPLSSTIRGHPDTVGASLMILYNRQPLLGQNNITLHNFLA